MESASGGGSHHVVFDIFHARIGMFAGVLGEGAVVS